MGPTQLWGSILIFASFHPFSGKIVFHTPVGFISPTSAEKLLLDISAERALLPAVHRDSNHPQLLPCASTVLPLLLAKGLLFYISLCSIVIKRNNEKKKPKTPATKQPWASLAAEVPALGAALGANTDLLWQHQSGRALTLLAPLQGSLLQLWFYTHNVASCLCDRQSHNVENTHRGLKKKINLTQSANSKQPGKQFLAVQPCRKSQVLGCGAAQL